MQESELALQTTDEREGASKQASKEASKDLPLANQRSSQTQHVGLNILASTRSIRQSRQMHRIAILSDLTFMLCYTRQSYHYRNTFTKVVLCSYPTFQSPKLLQTLP